MSRDTTFPTRAQVVIIGGGVIGTSVAYHLTRMGWEDVVLFEQGQLSSGTTWHAAGLVGQLRATEGGTRLVQYSAQLYETLEAETGLATGFKRCGGVTVARSEDRMVQLKRTAASAASYGLECELISPERAKELYPPLFIDDLVGAIWLPGDGTANPVDVTASLARGARDRGARIFEKTRVTAVEQADGRVTGVVTDQGAIEADVVVNCAGQWAKAVGLLAGVNVPLHSSEHFYVVTEQIDGVHPNLPILRDPDGYTYFKEEVGGLVVGGFEPEAKPWVPPDELPYPFEFQLLDEDWEHFSVLMDSALLRIPALHHTGIRKFYNGPESFTPDNQFIMGEAPELRNFYVGAGFNSVGIASAGGAGRALAEWITQGEPTSDLVGVDIRRFAPFNGNNQWLRARVGEILGLHYEVPWPNRELVSARPFRRSPVYGHLAEKGALFGSRMGWERANVFAPEGKELTYTWGKPEWLAWSNGEQRSTREAVTVFDETSFGKLLVTGRHVEQLLQRLCTADVAVDVGTVVYTGMLNMRGGYEADITLTRTRRDEYLLVTSSASAIRDRVWIERHIEDDEHVAVVDISGSQAVFGVMGPRSRELLASLSRSDLGNDAFPFATSQEIDLGQAWIRATRITYVGELGWELYVPVEFAVGVYDSLFRAGQTLGIPVSDAGYYAINSLRLDKGYRAFGAELNPDRNPVEAGLLFTCKLGTDTDFIGRDAVEQVRGRGPNRRLVSFVLEDPEVMMWGGELLLRDGEPAGQVTSAAWSDTLGAAVGLAYLWRADGEPVTAEHVKSGSYHFDVGGDRIGATVGLKAPFDPGNERIKG